MNFHLLYSNKSTFTVCYNPFIDNRIINENLDFGGGVAKDIYVCKGSEAYFRSFYYVNWRNLYLSRGVWEPHPPITRTDAREIIRERANTNVKSRWAKMDKTTLRYADTDLIINKIIVWYQSDRYQWSKTIDEHWVMSRYIFTFPNILYIWLQTLIFVRGQEVKVVVSQWTSHELVVCSVMYIRQIRVIIFRT